MKLRTVESVRDVAAKEWDACANPNGFNPFVSHAFYLAVEQSDSAIAETGWRGLHLILEDESGAIIGIAPCYLKNNSYGEYVFDHGWADAYGRAGGRYYPKLQCAVPFTPATGPRLLAASPENRARLAAGLVSLCQTVKSSSVHITFMPEEDARALEGGPWLRRTDTQFHWTNAGFATFEDFLAALSSRKRKNIRKERAAAKSSGVDIQFITGSDIREEHWDAFFAFYMDTGSRKWGTPYLTREFFSLIGATMADHILLIMCKRNGRWIAGALNLIGSDALYGRNWGAIEHHDFLHFEACYYQAMDFAIAQKLPRIEAGAQGEHKLARGYLPVQTHSLHHLADPRLARAVADYLAQERREVDRVQGLLAEHGPFRANRAERDA